MAEAAPGNIVKEGWLQKRGEHIRNWRDRYFILFDNGDLVGFKTQPERNNYRDPLNKFTVRDCQIMAVDKPRPYTFTIRGLQWTTVIERNFSVDNEKERSVDAVPLLLSCHTSDNMFPLIAVLASLPGISLGWLRASCLQFVHIIFGLTTSYEEIFVLEEDVFVIFLLEGIGDVTDDNFQTLQISHLCNHRALTW